MAQVARNVVDQERLTGVLPSGSAWLDWLRYRYATPEAATDPTPDVPLSEEQLTVELCAMARHAARSTGRAPLNPAEQVQHQRLEEVRSAVQEAQKKGATGRCSTTSAKR
jgi:hypothetical protein